MNRQQYESMTLMARANFVAETLASEAAAHLRRLVAEGPGHGFKWKAYCYGGTEAFRPHGNRIDEFVTSRSTTLTMLGVSVAGFDSETVNRIWNTALASATIVPRGTAIGDTRTTLAASTIDPIQEQPIMGNPNKLIDTVTYFRGRDINDMSADQKIDAIKALEKEIKDLDGIATQSTAIAARKEKLQAAIAVVVAALDA